MFKVTMKTPKLYNQRISGVFIDNFEQIEQVEFLDVFPVPLWFLLSMFRPDWLKANLR